MTTWQEDVRRRWVTVEKVVKLSGADDRVVPYTRTGATYRPDMAEITYRQRSGEGWRVTVMLSGQKVKKDGSLGATRARETYYHTDILGTVYRDPEIPEWVRTMARELTPDV